MPPLPNFDTAPQSNQEAGKQDVMSALMSGIAPVKNSVDSINQACRMIVKSGVIPGAEQICGQIISLATQLLPMAAQNLLQPQGGSVQPGGGAQGGGPGQMSMLPPPGGPAPMQ